MSNKLIERLSQVKDEAEALNFELLELNGAEELTEDQEARFALLTGDESPIPALVAEKETLEKRLAVLEAASNVANTEIGEDRAYHVQVMKQTETDVDIRTAGRGEVRSASMKRLEEEVRDQITPVSDANASHLENLFARYTVNEDGEVLTDGDAIARRFLATETPAYRAAFQKALRGHESTWTDEERQAMTYFRAAEQSLTSASGGYGVPVFLDPSIILTSGAEVAPLLSVSRIETITSNVWKGVSSTGVTFAVHTEGAAITAGQATLAQPTITPEVGAAFIPYSVEIQGDYPAFASEMQSLINQGWIDYLAVETATGAAGLVGIFTAIDAVSASEVAVTTDGTLSPTDAVKVFKALPERYRSRAAWFMNITSEMQLRSASALGGLYTTDLTTEGIGPLFGKRVLLSDYAPSFSGTTGAANLAIVGDFQKFVIVQRAGMTIENINHVVDSNGVPKLQRGFVAWGRAGSDAVDTNAFRLLQNT
jgi:HK97 family phage major capsid protein